MVGIASPDPNGFVWLPANFKALQFLSRVLFSPLTMAHRARVPGNLGSSQIGQVGSSGTIVSHTPLPGPDVRG